MPKVTLSIRSLRYVLPHVSTEASRPILGGVLLEPSGVIVATNGKTLVAHAHAVSGVTRPIILEFPKISSKGATLEFIMPDTTGGPIVTRVFGERGLELETIVLREVEGPFPNWRAVFPASDAKPVPSIGVDPEIVARFHVKGTKSLESIALEFFASESAVRVTYPKNADVAGLIMPVRLTQTLDTGWVARSATWEPVPSVD
jgi:DNA polymerase III sliding clamp (beta) subunit (PCNA family)